MKFLLEKSLKKYTFLIASPDASNEELDIYEVTYKEESLFDAYKKCVEERLGLEVDDDITFKELKGWNRQNDADNDTCIIGIESDEYDESPNDWYYDTVRDSVTEGYDNVTIDDDVLEKWFGINREDYQDDEEDEEKALIQSQFKEGTWYYNGKYVPREMELKVKKVIIPNNITSIGEYAFSGCYNLTSIVIPNNITSIGEDAFRFCKSLTSITIPNSVTSIGKGAFSNCESLTNIVLPNSVTNIGRGAFEGCLDLTSITIPNSITSISEDAFRFCHRLTNVEIPNSVTSIGSKAFGYCIRLTNAIIPTSVTSIGDEAFTGCTKLTSIVIPSSITSIGDEAFSECENLKNVYYQGSKEDWDKIKIGSDNNDLLNANIHFNSTLKESKKLNARNYLK